MFIFRNLLFAITNILNIAITIYIWIIIARAVISWVHLDPRSSLVRILYQITEPVLAPIRKFLPPTGVDFSPLIALLLLYFLQLFLIRSLFDLINAI
ncbi:YGGT family protein [bacterium BMS3Abin05]|nr:YGGT family protein [bacterium BMS3Abin05]GBE26571.1 YGGT family protein [bacterium BMS3Bbin03]HDK36332.1 YggT family protein [Bacteroidota bacterium]HDL78387.1 YggT family protein [Bacteroidota bacterium]HDZ10694.1 YggT family protein [Bacteroidota bacterium]